jgi:hypothetical protein
MPSQTGRNVLVAFKAETTFNTPPVVLTGAKRFRPNPGGGLKLQLAEIAPNEVRNDGMTSMPRLGSRSVSGGYAGDLSVGTFDDLIEAALRGTWVATVAITQATTLGGSAAATSITTTANTIVAAAGSWITQGVRVGDVVRLTGHSTVANNNRNLRVTGVTALVITVAETIVLDATPDASFTLTISKKITQPTVPVRRSFTFEEYEQDVDLTEQGTGVRVSSMKISGQPDGMCIIEFGLVGADLNPLTTGTSPFYTSPTLTSTIALTLVDATIRFGGADIAVLTAFEVMYDLTAKTLPVIGSVVTPDVFENPSVVKGSISGVRSDMTNLTRFKAETELELQVLAVEPESEPKDFVSIFLPRIKLTGVDKAFGSDGAMIEALPFTAGPKENTTGYDTTMIAITTSAP